VTAALINVLTGSAVNALNESGKQKVVPLKGRLFGLKLSLLTAIPRPTTLMATCVIGIIACAITGTFTVVLCKIGTTVIFRPAVT